MEKTLMQRTTSFRWDSRLELYQYFKDKFNLDTEKVDTTIYEVMAGFKPRVGQIIRTQELWQKVGLVLERAC